MFDQTPPKPPRRSNICPRVRGTHTLKKRDTESNPGQRGVERSFSSGEMELRLGRGRYQGKKKGSRVGENRERGRVGRGGSGIKRESKN